MLFGYSPLIQTAMATTFTWGATVIGAFVCYFQPTNKVNPVQNSLFLDCSLGFSAGVMLAASFWSLLEPAIHLAASDTQIGGLELGKLSFLPASIGFTFGMAFIIAANYCFPNQDILKLPTKSHSDQSSSCTTRDVKLVQDTILRKRLVHTPDPLLLVDNQTNSLNDQSSTVLIANDLIGPRINDRLWLLLLAITVHNIPEGFAVGVAFGHSSSNSYESFVRARNLALGMAIQNFPEGLAVSLPLHAAGYSFWKSLWYGQLSGFVEPVAGIIGCCTVQYIYQLQPFALGFAAGAMIFVILDDVIPEAHKQGNGRNASIMACLGFVLMMALDVGFSTK